MKRGSLIWISCAALAAMAAVLAWQAAGKPLVADEIEFVQTGPAVWQGRPPAACGGPAEEIIVHHPQGYHLFLGMLMTLLGPSKLAARVPGILSLLLSIPLAAWIANQLYGDRDNHRGMLAGLLLATAPLAVQGALLVDIDNTLMTPALLVFIGCVIRRMKSGGTRLPGLAGLSAGFAGLLWIKLTTPFLATAALFFCGLGCRTRRRLMGEAVLITLLGCCLFAMSWLVFCGLRGLEPAAPLVHLASRLGRGSGEDFIMALLKNNLRLALWLGPWLPLAAWAGLRAGWYRQDRRIELHQAYVLICALLIWIGYLLIGGNAFGFPRYHVPLVPLLAVMAAGCMDILLRRPVAAAMLTLAALIYWLAAVRDPLWPVFTLHESIAAGDLSGSQALKHMALVLALWLAPMVLLMPGLRNRLRLADTALLAPACGVALLCAQFGADYNTNYLYGERGLAAAIDRLAALPTGNGVVLAPKDAAFQALPCGGYLFASRTISQGRLAPLLEQNRLSAVVYRKGLLADASTGPKLRAPEVTQLLERNFTQVRVGDFYFFTAKGVWGENQNPPRS
jgi:4-amino-4-deoxy-L-arabinose transferase-like glycosyltransferase